MMTMTTNFRADGLNNPLSPNGGNLRLFVRDADGNESGPYSCPREAELAMKNEDDEIVDHRGNQLDDSTSCRDEVVPGWTLEELLSREG
jgi:hypothetical protein